MPSSLNIWQPSWAFKEDDGLTRVCGNAGQDADTGGICDIPERTDGRCSGTR